MLRKILVTLAATAVVGTMAMAPTVASAKGGHHGGGHGLHGGYKFHGYKFHGFKKYGWRYGYRRHYVGYYGDCWWVKKPTYWGFKYIKVCS